MITTVTTVTTVTAIAAMGVTAALSIAATITLIVFLTARELAGAGHSQRFLRVAKFVSVGILPLAMAFAVIVAITIVGALA